MKIQYQILLGVAIWLLGVVLDAMLIRYSYLLIHLGTLITVISCFQWLRLSENRLRLRRTLKPKGNFGEQIQQAFDFSWSRLSIIWTVCALGGMLIVHLGALAMGSTGAYKAAVNAIYTDQTITEHTGEVLDFGYMVSGNSTTNGTSNLSIGIIGSKSNVRIQAIVSGSGGNYRVEKLSIQD